MSHAFENYLKSKGIERQTSAPNAHQQNGRAERINQTILKKAEAICHASGCPKSWWNICAVHVYNQTPLRRTQWQMPYENLYDIKPDIQYFPQAHLSQWIPGGFLGFLPNPGKISGSPKIFLVCSQPTPSPFPAHSH